MDLAPSQSPALAVRLKMEMGPVEPLKAGNTRPPVAGWIGLHLHWCDGALYLFCLWYGLVPTCLLILFYVCLILLSFHVLAIALQNLSHIRH